MNFGINLKNAREKAGLTQASLAEKIGVTRPFVNQMERGTKEISLRNAILIAEICGCTLAELAGSKTA